MLRGLGAVAALLRLGEVAGNDRMAKFKHVFDLWVQDKKTGLDSLIEQSDLLTATPRWGENRATAVRLTSRSLGAAGTRH